MKKFTILLACLTVITTLVACNNETTTERTAPVNSTSTQIITGSVSVTGKVTEIYGNELVLRLAEGGETTTQTARPTEMTDGEVSQRPNMTEMTDDERTAMRENMTNEGENSSVRENSQVGRGQQTTQMPVQEQELELEDEEETTESDVATSSVEATTTSAVKTMSIGFANTSLILNGGPGADRDTSAMGERDTSMMFGDRTNAMSGSTTSVADIVLTNDVGEYLIPVGTPVYSNGTALSFSQIYKDNYIIIYMNDDGNVVSVNILG